ncbi:M48 family metalloprotease [Streptomyces sp. NPDC002265]|uniref:M48 family metalloprotease n=1 Tax=Streptomyces sp. NPDC002265 TaxID=3154415 RepID=UPI003330707D
MDIRPQPLREWLLIGAMLTVAWLPHVVVGIALTIAGLVFHTSWALVWLVGMLVAGATRGFMGRDRLPGRAVRPEDEPELVALVQDVAERVGFREPLLVRIVPDVDASMGPAKVGGVRTYVLLLGLPLLRMLTDAQLASVVAHELAHVHHARDRRMSALRFARGCLAERMDGRLRPLGPPAAPLLRATQPRMWQAETAADADAVRVAGTAATAGALRRTGIIHAAFEGLGADWVLSAAEEETYPEDLYAALESALAEPLVADRSVLSVTSEEEMAAASPYAVEDHPPLGHRIAALPADVEAATSYTGAPLALRTAESVERWCVRLLAGLEDTPADDMRPVRLLDLPDERLHALSDRTGLTLLKGATGHEAPEEAVAAALDTVADGSWPRLARRLEPQLRWMPATVRSVAAPQVVSTAVVQGLESVLHAAGWTHANRWINSVLVAPDGTTVVDLYEPVTAALKDGDPEPVRTLLATAATARKETAA